ncbi:MAG: Unknown protein [uncultured Sulfurovum sp.]|uniref:Antirepressor protein C-terminal domain-containing protein n=1 Tax=uncultured Sulfurovum sp. TaxID=269237 RepID=A0A6S6TNH0_9BACT|nr:MAG: Unknown protein [uncultured Sulfurovum sp.]
MSKIRRILEILFEKKEKKMNTVEETVKDTEYKIINKKHKRNYITVEELAKYFDLKEDELNQIFQTLGWSREEKGWMLMTDLGKYYGAKECYDNKTKMKYLKWHQSVRSSSQLIKTVQELTYNEPLEIAS